MKKGIFVLIAVLLIGAGGADDKIYSIDEYDGYQWYGRGGQDIELQLKGKLRLDAGYSNQSLPFVTFDISSIDLTKTNSINLYVRQTGGEKNFQLNAELWLTKDQDYENLAKVSSFPRDEIKPHIKMTRLHPQGSLWVSDDLRPVLKEHTQNKKYITFNLFPTEFNSMLMQIEFFDGNRGNRTLRPFLEIK